ncbi:MAG: hypothetical protein ACF8R7_09450 [Phycisphaerales bacterium JB039]
MRNIAAAVLGLALLGGATAVVPTATAIVATAPEVSKGKVVSINQEESSFIIKTGNDEQVMVKFDNKTAWYLDGELSTRSAVLQKDREVKVTHEEGVATRVDAKS